MVKALLSSLLAVAVVATPVVAEARGRDHYPHRERHHGRGLNTGEAIAVGLGAFIIGSAIADSKAKRQREQEYRRQYCREVITTGYDEWGDYYEKRTIRC